MIRNYNGNVNRKVLRGLQNLCKVNDENMSNFMQAFTENGQVSFYTNLCPITGCPDEMSELHILKSEEEIKEFLKKYSQERLEEFLRISKVENDYLISGVVYFINENERYPIKEEMKQIECAAEAKRVAELPADTSKQTQTTEQDVMKEILDLAEEIMEARRESKPEDVKVRSEDYPDTLWVENEDFEAVICWNRYCGTGDNRDYSLKVTLKDYKWKGLCKISFYRYGYDDTVTVSSMDYFEEEYIDYTTDCLITIHKGIVEIAKQEGVEFITEVDYQNIITTKQ